MYGLRLAVSCRVTCSSVRSRGHRLLSAGERGVKTSGNGSKEAAQGSKPTTTSGPAAKSGPESGAAVDTPAVKTPGDVAKGMTKEEVLAARQARRAEQAKLQQNPEAGTAGSSGAHAAPGQGQAGARGAGGGSRTALWWFGLPCVAAAGAMYVKEEDAKKLMRGSWLQAGWTSLVDKTASVASYWAEPHSEKLLPDWPLPQVPPDTPCPPTLVLDLEHTLVAPTWSRKNGWRFAKRPGAERFLKEMHQLYEIVVFTSTTAGVADPVITSLDPQGYISWRLYREATKFTGGKHIKDVSKLNRDERHIIIVDDDPACFSLQPDNAILVKPYKMEEGEHPAADRVLEELTPFLRAVATQGVKDVRPILSKYRGQDSSAIVADYRAKVNAIHSRQSDAQARGLGGLIRKRGMAKPPPAAAAAGEVTGGAARGTLVPSSKELVGAAPAAAAPGGPGPRPAAGPVDDEHKGGVWKRYRERVKEQEEEQMRKREVWNRVMEKKQEQKRRQQQEEAAAAAASGAGAPA